jgi:hypothetical protein
MNIFQGGLWWVGGFLVVALIFVVVMLMRNNAAKTDKVGHTKDDAIRNSVSIKPKESTTKRVGEP